VVIGGLITSTVLSLRWSRCYTRWSTTAAGAWAQPARV